MPHLVMSRLLLVSILCIEVNGLPSFPLLQAYGKPDILEGNILSQSESQDKSQSYIYPPHLPSRDDASHQHINRLSRQESPWPLSIRIRLPIYTGEQIGAQILNKRSDPGFLVGIIDLFGEAKPENVEEEPGKTSMFVPAVIDKARVGSSIRYSGK